MTARAMQEELESVQRELAGLRGEHHRLASSATMQLAEAVKRLPLVYSAYLKLKALLRARPG